MRRYLFKVGDQPQFGQTILYGWDDWDTRGNTVVWRQPYNNKHHTSTSMIHLICAYLNRVVKDD